MKESHPHPPPLLLLLPPRLPRTILKNHWDQQFQELTISKIGLLITLGQKVECGKGEEEEVEVEVVSVSEAEVVSEVEELGLEVVVEVAQEVEGAMVLVVLVVLLVVVPAVPIITFIM